MPTKPGIAHVTELPTGAIRPNPHNPRRLFDEEPMQILEESIQKLGILVPLTVYEPGDAAKHKARQFVLLDGERRWRCAQKLKLAEVPAIIVEEPSEEYNILTMFHIHNVREGWQLMPTALKLQTLMARFGEANERKLRELTKLSIPQIRRCKILLTYPKNIQNLMLAPTSERMKADFFIELQRIRGPALSEEFPPWTRRGDNVCIHIILAKYLDGVIKAVTQFRRLTEVYRASAAQGKLGRFMHAFDEFLENRDRPIEAVNVPGASFAQEAKELRRSASRLLSQLDNVRLEDVSADEELVELLRRLSKVLHGKLDEALLSRVRDEANSDD
jgi:ParB family transcriptional regulator, chromosome partitioning protein